MATKWSWSLCLLSWPLKPQNQIEVIVHNMSVSVRTEDGPTCPRSSKEHRRAERKINIEILHLQISASDTRIHLQNSVSNTRRKPMDGIQANHVGVINPISKTLRIMDPPHIPLYWAITLSILNLKKNIELSKRLVILQRRLQTKIVCLFVFLHYLNGTGALQNDLIGYSH